MGCLLFSFLYFSACSTRTPFLYEIDDAVRSMARSRPAYPDTRFAVISDPHFYDVSLGTTGSAFKKYLEDDRKLLVLSREILDSAIDAVGREKPRFVLVPGDMTKDGERVNHEKVTQALKRLTDRGIKVYVVPGNHDINNPDAVRYEGDETRPVPTIGPEEFSDLYRDFGYADALSRDEHSLSYTFEPEPGLWILALDSCRWKENRPGHHPIVDGAFSPATLAWIESRLISARKQNKAVLAFMHHGLMAHYPANEKFYGEYIVDDSDTVAELLAVYGVRLVFTGHFHAQDVVRKNFENHPSAFVFDIETGSLVTAPCPFRVVDLKNGHLAHVRSVFIDAVPSVKDGFQSYARDFVFHGTVTMAEAALDKYRVAKDQQSLITGQVAEAYLAHLLGDEQKPDITINRQGFGWWLKFIAWMQEDLIDGWWTDLPPKDNHLTIDLHTGDVF